MDAMEQSKSFDPWSMISNAIGTQEHLVRQKGVGLEMTKKDMKVPPKPCKKWKKKSALECQVEMMACQMEMMKKELADIMEHGGTPSQNPLEVPIVDSANDSCTPYSRLSSLSAGLHKCDLLALFPLKGVACSRLVIHAGTTITQQATMHTKPLLENQRRMRVDKAEVADAPLPIPTVEFEEALTKGRISALKKDAGGKGKIIKTGASTTPTVVEKSAPTDVGSRKVQCLTVLISNMDNVISVGDMVHVEVLAAILRRNSVA